MSTVPSHAPEPPVFASGQGSLLRGCDGTQWTDLVSGFGAVFLGHGHPTVVGSMAQQLDRLWACGRNPTAGQAAVDALMARLLPPGLVSAGLVSTGMEAAEFALRIAAVETGRQEFLAFGRSMHGKSALTASLCWPNAPVRLGAEGTLPFIDEASEDEVLSRLEDRLRARRIAALLLEPLQGSNAGHQASARFCEQAMALCRAHGTLFLMDEILTGLHRTGAPFYSSRLATTPDLLLFAKSMGNGFPVACVARAAHVTVRPQALPGSTFSGNPLALAAVQGTLSAMEELPLGDLVRNLERIALQEFEALRGQGIPVRGAGALWCLQLEGHCEAGLVMERLRAAQILATCTGGTLRLLPAATMPPDAWAAACAEVTQACLCARRVPA